MASRSRLYTRFRPSSTNQNEEQTGVINMISLNINIDDTLINDDRIKRKIFSEESIDSCFDYITSGITNIHLFVLNNLGNVAFQLIGEYPQIKYVYIFSTDNQYRNYSNVNGKFRGIFDELNEMVKKFLDDIIKPENLFYSEQSTFQNIDEESSEILWWNFFDKVSQYIKDTDTAMDEFIHFCKEIYQNNQRELLKIDEFRESYTDNNAIWWYTRDSFLYRLLNRSLRTSKNLSDIFKFRFFVNHLKVGLKREQMKSFETVNTLVTYRGQIMSSEQLNRLRSSVGQSIFSNQFLSTSLNKEIAKMSTYSNNYHSSSQNVLIVILVEPTDIKSTDVPFGNISDQSVFREEEEVLFSVRSTFLIQSVEPQEENLWIVHLKYVDNIWNIDFGERSIFSPHADEIYIRHLSKENKQFIASQLLVDMLLRLDHNEYAKQELLEFCRFEYRKNEAQLTNIDDFEQNYRSENAVRWYTKDSFLFRLLNQSLRKETIDPIVKLRYFIHDLHNHLAELQAFDGEENLTLYRGQPMKIDELNELRKNYDGLISLHSFTSFTADEIVAFPFSGDGTTTASDEVSVIYEVSVDTSIRSTPFARIESINPDEKEILFSMGAVFRIGNVEEIPDHPGVHRVKLKLEHIEDKLWNKLTKHLD